MTVHIIKAGDEYLVVYPFQIKENHYVRHLLRTESLDTAQKYVRMIAENGVPANNISSGGIDMFTPVMKFRNNVSRVKRKRNNKN